MNTKSRNSNVPGLLLLVLFLMALLAACSGGNIDVSIDGARIPPGSVPPFPNREVITTQGSITGFGNLAVNGVRYDTTNASVLIDSDAASLSELRLGHVITLTGRIDILGATGQATTIRMHSQIIGPVETVDVANSRLLVMGQTVRLRPDTEYSANIDPVTLAGLAAGDRARISGYTDAAGNIRATRVELADATAPLHVTGKAGGHDAANFVFEINQLTVDYRNAVFIDLPGGAPSDGMTVKAIGNLSNGLFLAEQLVSAPSPTGNQGQRVQLGGIVTRFASSADFGVNDIAVTTNSSTMFSGGTPGDLRLNTEVMIDGEFGTSGRIRAERVTVGRLASRVTTLTYDVDGFTSISVPTVFGISVAQGTEYSVEVMIDEEAAGRVEVTKNGSNLTIALRTGNGQIETIDRIDLTGVVNARLYGFDQAQMTMNVGGVSNLRGDALRIGRLQAAVSGVSRMDLGDIRPIGEAHIDVSGVSQATLNMDVGASLSGSVSTGQGTGTSALFYYGTNVALDVDTGANASVIWLGGTRQ